jgi:hypothetical protein
LDTAHQQAQKTAEVIDDYARPIETVNAANPTANVKTVAYSYGYSGNSPYSRLYYIAARGVSGMANKGGNTNYNNVGSHSMNGTVPVIYTNGGSWTMEGSVRALYDPSHKLFGGTNFYGGWVSLHSHGLSTDLINPDIAAIDKNGNGKANTYEVLDYTFENYLAPAMESGNIWQDSFTNIAMYAQERDSSTLSVTAYGDKITYTLTDLMDDTVFDCPLTVKLKVDPSWSGVKARQNNGELDVTVKEEGGNKYVLVKSLPDGGVVTVEPAKETLFEGNGIKITNPGVISENGNTVFTAAYETEENLNPTAYFVKYASGGQKLSAMDLAELNTAGVISLEVPEITENEEIYLFIWDGNLSPKAHKIDLNEIIHN